MKKSEHFSNLGAITYKLQEKIMSDSFSFHWSCFLIDLTSLEGEEKIYRYIIY